MKSKLLRFLSILMIGFMFLACENPAGNTDDGSSSKNNSGNNSTSQQQNGGGSKDNSGGTQQGNGGKQNGSGTQQGEAGKQTDSESTQETKIKLGVQFNFEGAKALAKLEEKKNSSRAATNADDLGDLVKIMADGSMENAITVGDNCSLSDIVAIYKSPKEDSKDIFIVLNGESTIGRDENYSEIRVGQLICLHENGSITDILKKDDSTDYWNSHVSLKTETVTFDAAGNVYFISSDNGDMIYQYNPATDELTKMVAAVENTYYVKMQIDDEGQWIFVSGSRNSTYFLRAIPIGNPNAFVNIFYSSNDSIGADKWAYDAKNGKMYFIVNDGNKSGLFIATKAGGFKDKSFCHYTVGAGFENNLFEYFYGGGYNNFYWPDEVKTDDIFDANKLVDILLSNSCYFYDEKEGAVKRLTRNDVDIRFDKYFSATDQLKALAVLTAGKKNEEAFEALNNSVGLAALHDYSNYTKDRDGKNWFQEEPSGGFRHNFLADILYIKDTDILITDSDDVVFTYFQHVYDEDGNCRYDENDNYIFKEISVKGKDLFGRKQNGLYNGPNIIWFVSGNSYGENMLESYKTFGFKSGFYNEDGILDSKLLFEYLCSFCNVEGTKEFRLSELKDDKKFGALYTNLTNEKALEWIASDVERLNLFGQLFRNGNGGNYDYSSFMNTLSKIMFIAGTNQKAVTWNWSGGGVIDYSYYSWEGAKLTATDTGIYYEYYNTSGTDPYYYIVQVADSDGKLVELVNKLPLPSGKVVKSEKNNNRILLQYSVMDENGAELGYHHIYSVEMANGKVTNCFDNVPNRNNLEVVSFNSAGDLLYYSAVRGTAVENGIVNIVTNEYNPLTVQRKMVAVYTFN